MHKHFSFSDTVNATCFEGYTLVGDATRICLPDGTWSGSESVCKPVECKPLSDLKNGRTMMKSLQFGGRTEYSCNTGYRLRGAKKRTCKSDQTWSDKEPVCQIILCPDPPTIANGFVLLSKEVSLINHIYYSITLININNIIINNNMYELKNNFYIFIFINSPCDDTS